MAPKGRWGRKEKDGSRAQPAEGPAPGPVLPVRQKKYELKHEDCTCVLLENYYTISECEKYLDVLTNEIDWKRQEVTLANANGGERTVDEPRLTLFMSDPGISYAYSGRDNEGVGWHPAILEIKEKAERALVECGLPATTFNSAQMNRYNGPRHTLGMHADNEPDLLKGAPIASVSFGAPRAFKVQNRDDSDESFDIELADGAFMVMAGAMQQKYLHGVPVGATGLRFNLTFRVCIPRGGSAADAESRRRALGRQAAIDAAARESREGADAGAKEEAKTKVRSDAPAADEPNRSQPAANARGGYASAAGRQPDRATGRGGYASKAGSGSSDAPRRLDPYDGRAYVYEELLLKYTGQYSESEIAEYWRDTCKPAR